MPKDFVDGGVREFPGASNHPGNRAASVDALAALFIACDQDVACVSEAATGLTRLDVTSAGDLYLSVSLPNLIVGTIGGGTAIPTARECLQMMDCYGAGKARKFAENYAATVLAGELSLIGAITAGQYGEAHAL